MLNLDCTHQGVEVSATDKYGCSVNHFFLFSTVPTFEDISREFKTLGIDIVRIDAILINDSEFAVNTIAKNFLGSQLTIQI